jgi:tetratricopeptide (TPR) repeat protein
MRKLVLLLTVLLATTIVFAQKSKVTSAISYKDANDLTKAKALIEETIDSTNEKSASTITWPRTWEARGEIYEAIHKSGKNLEDKPLFTAYDSYKKAVQLDEKGRFAKSLSVKFTLMQQTLTNFAITSFESNKFDVSLECFEKILEINELPIMRKGGDPFLDTAIVYNAGLTAFKAENWPKAIEYFELSAKNDYNSQSCYNFMYQAYQSNGDTLTAITRLKEGFEKFPTDEALMYELIKFYIRTGKAEDALQYIEKAIDDAPENASLWSAKGSMLEKIGKEEDAIKAYLKSAEIDPKELTPWYNLSVIYYNRGVKLYNESVDIPASEKKRYEETLAKAEEQLKEGLPFVEKAYELNPNEIAILESLRMFYYRLRINDKYEEVNQKLQSLKQ